MSSKFNRSSITAFVKNDFLDERTQKVIDGIIENLPTPMPVEIYYFNVENNEIPSLLEPWNRKPMYNVTVITSEFTPPELNEESIIIDALFGFEISSPLEGGFAAIVNLINNANATVFSIAAPSGLLPSNNTSNNRKNIVKATFTILLQQPPICYYFPENQIFFGDITVNDIADFPNYAVPKFTDIDDLAYSFLPRKRFSHKGNYGHGLIVAGKLGMAGAATLASKAALKSGIGLLTLHCPEANRAIHQIAIPEAILQVDSNMNQLSQLIDTNLYNATAIGPGIGTSEETSIALMGMLEGRSLQDNKGPLILDADALNLLENNNEAINNWLEGTIITPHPKELERLIGHYNNSYLQLARAINLAQESRMYIVLKGAYSMLINPLGEVVLNPTGCSGMATAGSGDVLTGILVSLLAQGYRPEEAMQLGCYIHGLAGEIASKYKGEIGMTASDIVEAIPEAWIVFSKKIN